MSRRALNYNEGKKYSLVMASPEYTVITLLFGAKGGRSLKVSQSDVKDKMCFLLSEIHGMSP